MAKLIPLKEWYFEEELRKIIKTVSSDSTFAFIKRVERFGILYVFKKQHETQRKRKMFCFEKSL